MSLALGQPIRYLGPYDECAGHAVHPYGGKIGAIVALVTVPPLPERPISIQFPDGTVLQATEQEVKDPAQPY